MRLVLYLSIILQSITRIINVEGALSPSSSVCSVAEYPNTNISLTRFAGVVFPNGVGVVWHKSKSPLNLLSKQFSYRIFIVNPRNMLKLGHKRKLLKIENSKVKPVPLVTRLLQNTSTI